MLDDQLDGAATEIVFLLSATHLNQLCEPLSALPCRAELARLLFAQIKGSQASSALQRFAVLDDQLDGAAAIVVLRSATHLNQLCRAVAGAAL